MKVRSQTCFVWHVKTCAVQLYIWHVWHGHMRINQWFAATLTVKILFMWLSCYNRKCKDKKTMPTFIVVVWICCVCVVFPERSTDQYLRGQLSREDRHHHWTNRHHLQGFRHDCLQIRGGMIRWWDGWQQSFFFLFLTKNVTAHRVQWEFWSICPFHVHTKHLSVCLSVCLSVNRSHLSLHNISIIQVLCYYFMFCF